MSIRQFIGASSTLLLVWLGVTFFHEVPVGRYQPKEAKTADLGEDAKKGETAIVSVETSEN
ncbi:MAG: hypothetical protein NWT08_08155 [Akkermansiaceae bacterium]|jgi:hypothetical protein|nr:hypothetical protein [Akkermansiaceae bacterium]MDP4647919.1 hypothetical protein [Akkermansiaceae bacterium]MDP4719708.1 hypothetical protein [Akkermansiaceae bacterium]MDP4781263.1 hypothetical protein [Akkermansiaceae bacterium]MDP4846019.1 hypothetical protein [Akkermansiaceae bacterium]